MNNTYFWTKEQINELKKIYAIKDMEVLVNSFNKSRKAISMKARRLGLNHKTRISTNTIRADFFKSINNPTKAYILGLIASDGCVYKTYLSFTSKDKILIEFMRNNLSPLSKIYFDKANRAFKLIIGCKKMINDLEQWNIFPRKSLTYKFPECLNSEMYKPFILGYFDGDGSYPTISDRGYKHKFWHMCGTKNFLRRVKQIIQKEINIIPNGPYSLKRQNHYFIQTSHKKAREINNWLIKDSNFFLYRKHI